MTLYAPDHADALADVAAAGAAVSFEPQPQAGSTYNPTTGAVTGSAGSAVPGKAIEIDGEFAEYKALDIIARDPATLLFVPTTYGSRPAVGALCSWGSRTRAIVRLRPIGPDGTPIAFYVVIAT